MTSTLSFEVSKQGSAVRPGNPNPDSPEYNSVMSLVCREPVFLPAGSVITLQDVAVDVARPAQSFKFSRDVHFSITVCPWKTYTDSDYGQNAVGDADFVSPQWVDDAGNASFKAVQRVVDLVLPAGSYTPTSLCGKLAALTTVAGPGVWHTSEFTNGMLGTIVSTNNTRYFRYNNDGTQKNCGNCVNGTPQYIGCPGLVFEFDTGLSKAELKFSHAPALDSTGQPMAVLRKDGSMVTLYWDRCGVVIRSIGGFSSWEDPENPFYLLGFAREDLEMPGDPDELKINPEDCPSYTQTFRTGNILLQTSGTPLTIWQENNKTQYLSTGPAGKVASNYPQGLGTASPRLHVECNLIPPNMICADGYTRRILGTISSSFEGNGFLWSAVSGAFTLPFDTTVSELQVRLLDPIGFLADGSSIPYIPATIGPDSSLIIRVDLPTTAGDLRNLKALDANSENLQNEHSDKKTDKS